MLVGITITTTNQDGTVKVEYIDSLHKSFNSTVWLTVHNSNYKEVVFNRDMGSIIEYRSCGTFPTVGISPDVYSAVYNAIGSGYFYEHTYRPIVSIAGVEEAIWILRNSDSLPQAHLDATIAPLVDDARMVIARELLKEVEIDVRRFKRTLGPNVGSTMEEIRQQFVGTLVV